jgi:dihydrofolate reductase
MAKLIMWNLMTLDGYVAGPNGDISWHEDVWGPELEAFSKEQGKAAGGLMFGRVTYDLMAGYWPKAQGESAEIANFMNALPKFVFSRTLKSSPWNNTQVFNDNVTDTVARLKRETPKDIFIFGSAGLAGSLIPAGLIDEFRICVVPRILGGGTPLFRQGERQKLKLLDAKPLSAGAAILRYEPAK